jgi:hypothetical protein
VPARKGPRIVERPAWASWVTPKLAQASPIDRWFTFPHSFSPELVAALVREWDLSSTDMVLDPFVGAGTTLLACQRAGIPSTGIDLSPLATLVTRAKTSPPSAEGLRDAWDRMRSALSVPTAIPKGNGSLLSRALPAKRLPTLRAAHSMILKSGLPDHEQRALLLALLAVLPEFSLLVRKGGWLAQRGKSLRSDQLRGALDSYVRMMSADLDGHAPMASAGVIRADSRRLPIEDGSISAVISSPPYPNRHDYSRVFGVELEFAFLDWQGVRDLRYQSIHSHPEGRPERSEDSGYAEPARLTGVIDQIEDGRIERRLPSMLHGYFQDAYLVIRELNRVLRRRGKAALVLGNVQYGGIPVAVDRFCGEIAGQAGLYLQRIVVARRRGNSAQQMKAHGRHPQRESVLLLTKL